MSQAGKFRERVTFYQPGALTQTATGGFVEGPETAFEAWAQVETLAAKESLENGKLTYKQPYKIIIRYIEKVDNVYQAEWNGVRIAINSVIQDVRRTEKIIFGYGVS